LFDVELMKRVAERAELEEALQEAIEKDQLTLHYQPKICARTHEITGVEALARWHHPERGQIPPDCFVPIAEQTGTMVAMGETVLKLAALQGQRWNGREMPIRIAVNVSAVQFESPHFVRTVLSTLEQSRFDPTLLELEVTETVAMSDFTSTKRLLDALRAEGIRIAIDDFGTGYSNLSQLARLSFDALKIDRSLVVGIGKNGKAEAMLDATVNMARALGHEVIAEGIETLEQMLFLEELGCDQFQGFFIARPMPAIELASWQSARSRNAVGDMQAGLSKRLNAA